MTALKQQLAEAAHCAAREAHLEQELKGARAAERQAELSFITHPFDSLHPPIHSIHFTYPPIDSRHPPTHSVHFHPPVHLIHFTHPHIRFASPAHPFDSLNPPTHSIHFIHLPIRFASSTRPFDSLHPHTDSFHFTNTLSLVSPFTNHHHRRKLIGIVRTALTHPQFPPIDPMNPPIHPTHESLALAVTHERHSLTPAQLPTHTFPCPPHSIARQRPPSPHDSSRGHWNHLSFPAHILPLPHARSA